MRRADRRRRRPPPRPRRGHECIAASPAGSSAPGTRPSSVSDATTRGMRNVIFAAPFPLETTMRFARAAARLPGVRLLGVAQTPPGGEDAKLFDDVVQVEDGLDAHQL